MTLSGRLLQQRVQTADDILGAWHRVMHAYALGGPTPSWERWASNMAAILEDLATEARQVKP